MFRLFQKKELKVEEKEISKTKLLLERLYLDLQKVPKIEDGMNQRIASYTSKIKKLEEELEIIFLTEKNRKKYILTLNGKAIIYFEFLIENEKVKKMKCCYFENLCLFPTDLSLFEESQSIYEYTFLEPKILIEKWYQRNYKYLNYESIPFYLEKICRYKDGKLITEELYEKGKLVERYYNFNYSSNTEFIKEKNRYNMARKTTNQFNKTYQNALALTKEKSKK